MSLSYCLMKSEGLGAYWPTNRSMIGNDTERKPLLRRSPEYPDNHPCKSEAKSMQKKHEKKVSGGRSISICHLFGCHVVSPIMISRNQTCCAGRVCSESHPGWIDRGKSGVVCKQLYSKIEGFCNGLSSFSLQ